MATLAVHAPETFEDAASALAAASAEGRPVRIAGNQTKPWGAIPAPDPGELALRSTRLDAIVAHNAGDMTATLQAGVTLAAAQRAFATAGQMLALDPPSGPGEPTIGGIVATADSGPRHHRYGGPRDLVVGATVALGDGTIARSGGTVIKNVAGYDIAKLLCGSFGTLGLILSVNVRLHPLPPRTVTVVATAHDPARLASAALALAALPAELEALDVAWEEGTGSLLARCGGRAQRDTASRATRVAAAMTEQGLTDVAVSEDDEALWERQRAGQRSTHRAVVRVAAAPGRLEGLLRAAQAAGGALVGRAALGHAYVALAPEAVGTLRAALPARTVSVLHDAPEPARAAISDPWGETPAPALALMRAVKARFDPTGTCNPGRFVGGI